MELLLIPVPLFNRHLVVEAYLCRYQLSSDTGAEPADTVFSPLLEAVNAGGVDAFTNGKPILVPIESGMLLGNLENQCRQPPERIVFLLEKEVPITEAHLSAITHLKTFGYRIAVYNAPLFDEPDTLLGVCDYVILKSDEINRSDRRAIVLNYKRRNRKITPVFTDLQTDVAFEQAVKDGGELFDGRFYILPITEGEKKITALKNNLIRLLNVVRDEDFGFDVIASVVQRDPALSVNLMRYANSPYIGVRHKIKTIHHAATVLGQDEIRRWVMATVFKSLGTDRPNELTRLSLVRARFAQNLAECYELRKDADSLFLMGMCSLLDVILDTSMPHALDLVFVSDDIRAALLSNSGRFQPVLELMQSYEKAEWTNVAMHRILYGLTVTDIYNAYIDAITWYQELLTDRVRPVK